MLDCPTCAAQTKVYYSWLSKAGVRSRRYACPNGHRFTSKEQITRVNPYGTAQSQVHNNLTAKVAGTS